MGFFSKKLKAAGTEIETGQAAPDLKEQVYPIIYTKKYIDEQYGKLSDEEVVISQQILQIKEAFQAVLGEVDGLTGHIQEFHAMFGGISKAADSFHGVRNSIIHSVEIAQEQVERLKGIPTGLPRIFILWIRHFRRSRTL